MSTDALTVPSSPSFLATRVRTVGSLTPGWYLAVSAAGMGASTGSAAWNLGVVSMVPARLAQAAKPTATVAPTSELLFAYMMAFRMRIDVCHFLVLPGC